MGRLIDRKVLLEFVKEELKQDRPYDLKIRNIQRFIEDMPTAYDIEKVVAELEYEKERHENDRSYWAEHEWKDRVVYNECDMSDRKADCYIDAIEIVRKGGVE